MDNQKRIALVETCTLDNGQMQETLQPVFRFQIDDQLNSSCLECNENGAIISYEEYYPYGSSSYHAVKSEIKLSLKRYRYTGKERDEESGLYYHGARYYISWLGRWTSPDPAGLADNLNLYIYAANNPIRFIDPEGTQAFDPEQEYGEITTPKNQNIQYVTFHEADIIEVNTSPLSESYVSDLLSEADEGGINIDFLTGRLFSLAQNTFKTGEFDKFFAYNQLYSAFANKGKSDEAKGWFLYAGSMIVAPFVLGSFYAAMELLSFWTVSKLGSVLGPTNTFRMIYAVSSFLLGAEGYQAPRLSGNPAIFRLFREKPIGGYMFGGKAGRAWGTLVDPLEGTWAFGKGWVNSMLRRLLTGSGQPYVRQYTVEIAGKALEQFVTPFPCFGIHRLWKVLTGQKFTYAPGNFNLLTQLVEGPTGAQFWRSVMNQTSAAIFDPMLILMFLYPEQFWEIMVGTDY
jgi:RHS repeat-associated protein